MGIFLYSKQRKQRVESCIGCWLFRYLCMFHQKEKMEDGLGLDYLGPNSTLYSSGSLLSLLDGTPPFVTPSKTGSRSELVMFPHKEKMEDGLGLDCLGLSSGLYSTGSLLSLFGGTPPFVTPSKTGSRSGTLSLSFKYSLSLSHRHCKTYRYEKELPGVDIFVCTADPAIEPPIMVINTVLSVMAYDYPPEKLSVYLSDDGCSDLTFYALLEASRFSKQWLPFCKKFQIEPRSPAAYFSTISKPLDPIEAMEWASIKKLYKEMKNQIEYATSQGRISEEIRREHRGFFEWDSGTTRHDHKTILQILIDGRDPKAVDIEGQPLPTLVYLAREKRPQYHHNYKAGAMNALIRVSSKISNGHIILNVDCDMYSNNSQSVRDALCFFMDEEKGHEIAYVQYPQNFEKVTKNDIYSSSLRVIFEVGIHMQALSRILPLLFKSPFLFVVKKNILIEFIILLECLVMKVELHGFDGNGGPCYVGTGCFHKRETLCGRKYNKEYKGELKREKDWKVEERPSELVETSKIFANCTYEENTQWGKEVSLSLSLSLSLSYFLTNFMYVDMQMGLMYGCLVEDIITGLAIQCRGWKSIYFNPDRKSFLGLAPTTLLQTLVQHKRWSEGDFEIFLSKYCPFTYGYGRITPGLQIAYCIFFLWAPNCLATIYYVVVPPLCLLKGIPLFPRISSPWFLPFAYVIIAKYGYSLGEFIWCGGTLQGWWNDQRMWMFKRTTSYLFGFIDIILRQLGFSKSTFVVTAKVVDDDVSQRYEQEIMEFGTSSPMFTILATLAFLNLFSLVGVVKRVAMGVEISVLEPLALQIIHCGLLVIINLPVYQGIIFRKDKGCMPPSLAVKTVILALLACSLPYCV
ncbi:hypothetical protein HHK36_023994 [Tetracentron sinense]|uniref:Uncharacterized protein n=1 Tax=Tetracentron sinense TaxID=13715 RepID=A0A834YP41_TETSI|nr:hypothetical protein HHK36_023994 [Tetracentron sinense]